MGGQSGSMASKSLTDMRRAELAKGLLADVEQQVRKLGKAVTLGPRQRDGDWCSSGSARCGRYAAADVAE